MANVTTCTCCSSLYEAGSEEQANEPDRLCRTCSGAALTVSQQACLVALCGGPDYAPAIAERVSEMTGGKIMMGPSVYPTLRGLEHAGLLESWEADPSAERGWRPRRYYRLTPSRGSVAGRACDHLARLGIVEDGGAVVRDRRLAWCSDNLNALSGLPHEWAAVSQDGIAASACSLRELRSDLDRRNVDRRQILIVSRHDFVLREEP